MGGSRRRFLEVFNAVFSFGESTGNVEWFSVAVSRGCSMLFFSWLKMASTLSGESTGNAESTLPTGEDGISVMVVLWSSLLRSGAKAKSSVSKSARHRSGNVQAIVVWKRDRQKKIKNWKNCVGRLKSTEKWWKCVKKSVMWVVKCWRDADVIRHERHVVIGWCMVPWNGLDAGTVIDGDGVSTQKLLVVDSIWGGFVTFDGVSTQKIDEGSIWGGFVTFDGVSKRLILWGFMCREFYPKTFSPRHWRKDDLCTSGTNENCSRWN